MEYINYSIKKIFVAHVDEETEVELGSLQETGVDRLQP